MEEIREAVVEEETKSPATLGELVGQSELNLREALNILNTMGRIEVVNML